MSHPFSLRAYQLDGVNRLADILRTRGAALLADEPGLGKTAQTLCVVNSLCVKKRACVIVVCPASLRLNWRKEAQRWLTVPCDLAVISYEEAVKCFSEDNGEVRPCFDLAVFDEAHYLKNPKAKRTKACTHLANSARKRLFLTGTPVVNRPMDMYPVLQLCGGKMTKAQFGKTYCAGKLIPIKWRNGKPSKYAWDFSGASNVDRLNDALRSSIMVRRTKQEVLTELPRKVRQVIEVDAPDGEGAGYRRLFASFTSAAEMIEAAPRLLFTELAEARLEYAHYKIPYVLPIIRDILEEEEKLVVFAYHREIIDELASALPDSVKLYGGMTDKQKDDAVSRFQNGDARVFVGQITAAGTGITLTAASTMVFVELDWVPGNIIQAEDRCHRFGQRNTVRILHIVLSGSIDAKMVQALVDKQQVIEQVTR